MYKSIHKITYMHTYSTYVATCIMQNSFVRFYSKVISPHLAVIFPNIFFSYIGSDESTSNNSMRCCFSSSVLMRKCTRLFAPCNHLITITTHRTCKYSTKWCSRTCISRLSNNLWQQNYKTNETIKAGYSIHNKYIHDMYSTWWCQEFITHVHVMIVNAWW